MRNNEKRTYDRIKSFLYICYSDGNRFLKEFVHDASPGGLMIRSSEPCTVGTLLDMAVDVHVPMRAKGTVTWVKKDEHTYNIGVQFKEMNSKAANVWAEFLNRSQELSVQ